jgi:hypothetical protein
VIPVWDTAGVVGGKKRDNDEKDYDANCGFGGKINNSCDKYEATSLRSEPGYGRNKMTKVVFFKEWGDPWHKTDDTGFNKTGYVTKSGIVIYPRRSRIARTTIEAVRKKLHRLVDLSTHPRAFQIEGIFTNNVINTALYVTAMQRMSDPHSRFWDNPVKIPVLSPISPEEHEIRWRKFVGALQRGMGYSLSTQKAL